MPPTEGARAPPHAQRREAGHQLGTKCERGKMTGWPAGILSAGVLCFPHPDTAMNLSALTALSPLDGRYATKVAALRPLLSEFGLMHRRVQVEVEWFIALCDAGVPGYAPLSD